MTLIYMSNHTNSSIYFNNQKLNRHIGGIDPRNNQVTNVNNQMTVLRSQDRLLPPGNRYFSRFDNSRDASSSANNQPDIDKQILSSNLSRTLQPTSQQPTNTQKTLSDVYLRRDSDRYNPYDGFIYGRGLMDDGHQKRRYVSHFVDVNSVFRTKLPTAETEDPKLMPKDSFTFTNKSSSIFVNDPEHNFEINDAITVTGVTGRLSILRTYIDATTPSFVIPRGCNFMKVFYNHGIPLSYTGTSILYEFQNILGDRGTSDTSSYLGTVPTNVLNTIQTVKLTLIQSDVVCSITDTDKFPPDPNTGLGYFEPSPNYFFVVIPVAMLDAPTPYTLRDFNYKIIQRAIAGIPLNEINATYPVSPENIEGYHIITSVNQFGYTFNVKTPAIVDTPNGLFDGSGSGVYIARITSIRTGYPNPNNYTIGLGEIYHDVIAVRLVSSEIPNTEKAIRELPSTRVNNKLYWNDIDDGDYLYSIQVPSGNYSPDQLAGVMEALFLLTPRINAEALGNTYTSRHFIRVAIDTTSDNVTFQSFKESTLIRPIIDTDPSIPDAVNFQIDPTQTYFIIVNHPNHGMTQPGLTVLIQNAISTNGIPVSILNSEHIVSAIDDQNNYRIALPKFNALDDKKRTGGGNSVFIYIPDVFRLRFDQPDTLGTVLGFRNPGDVNSVTPFSTQISNEDPYQSEINKNVNGETIVIKSNSLQLSGDNYIIMVAKPLETLHSLGPIKNVFSKIILCDSPGKILYNTYVPVTHYYDDPIADLFELEIVFYSFDGNLYDFNGVDHSFTLEIVTVSDIPEGTKINANTGKNYNLDI